MPRTFAAAVLLAVLALLVPGTAPARPPEGTSGKMVLERDQVEDVADVLRSYRKERVLAKRIKLLSKMARTHDPRVAVALGEALSDPNKDVQVQAAFGILYNQQEDFDIDFSPKEPLAIEWASKWWQKHKVDLRRRAAQLPK
jgi:hypothetical protein